MLIINELYFMETLSEVDSKYIKGWSLGAFLGPWIFLFVHKQNKIAWKFLVCFILIQIINLVPIIKAQAGNLGSILSFIYFGYSIWLGIKGREIVWDSKVYNSIEEFKKKRSLIINLVILNIIVVFGLTIYPILSAVAPIVKNPQMMSQNIEQQAFNSAKSKNPNINEIEFKAGYQKGNTDGKINTNLSFISDQTSSYQDGYKYGFMVSCMEVNNNQNLCFKKALGTSN